jgi:ribosomal protein S18 acetylase RimI-like enzyme
MLASPGVILTTPDVDRYETVEILIAALRDDPAVRSLYPTDIEYVRFFPGFLMALGGRAFEAGTVDCDDEGHAAALWFPPGIEPDSDAIMNHLDVSIPKKRLAPLAIGMEKQTSLHPSEPHWYLPWMGVVPEAQGMGIGGALLREGLARADADRLPVYLEATTRRSAAFYMRHGFEIMATVDLPGYPEIIAMWRPAR